MACRPGLKTINDYPLQRSLIPRKIAPEDLFGGTPRARGQATGLPAGVELPFNIK
jgi:hypothetical protein